MKKQLLGISGIIFILIVVIAFSIQNNPINKNESDQFVLDADVIMPTKVSRPGCEETDSCYIPSKFFASIDEDIIWINDDSAFHSVTSGFYGAPTELFDSGYLDPGQSFVLSFDKPGIYDYFCSLHPWMNGQIIIE